MAGGTGDIAFRVIETGGSARVRPSATSTATCWRSARERAASGASTRVDFEQGNAEDLPYADRSFDCVTIAFGIRNVPRIDRALAEAYRVLKIGGRFLCLEFSAVDVPGVDELYDLYSFKVIPRVGAGGDRRPRAPIAIWSNRSASFPSRSVFAQMIEPPASAAFR